MVLNRKFGQGRLFLLGLFLLFPLSASTQDLDMEEKKHSNSLKAGSWALQFEINKDFKFDEFQGLLISTKHHFSNKRAVRFGLGINSDISDVVLSNTQRQADTLVSRDSDQSDSSSFAFEIAAQYISYPSPTKQVNVFFGGGPHFRFGDSNFETRTLSLSPKEGHLLGQWVFL